MKQTPSKVAHNRPQFFFSMYCKPAQNQPKYNFLFHKNVSMRDFYIMTLPAAPFAEPRPAYLQLPCPHRCLPWFLIPQVNTTSDIKIASQSKIKQNTKTLS